MTNLNDILETLNDAEILELQGLIPKEIHDRKDAKKEEVKNKIVELYKEVNVLGRSIYTAKEIASILDVKEYLVADTIREYKKEV